MSDPQPMPANERGVHRGGLMRCCLSTLGTSTIPSIVGTVLSCEHHDDPNNENMIVGPAGVWRWNHS